MPDYVVKWEIDVTADSPREAAEQALAIQRDQSDSLATVFHVTDARDGGYDAGETIDLGEEVAGDE